MQHSESLKYRMKAAELRAIADDDHLGPTKADLLRIAEAYEKVALSLEQLEASEQSNLAQ